MHKIRFVIVLAWLLGAACLPNAYASQDALSKELNQYIDVFSGENFAAQRTAIEPLGWSGLSDPRLFDLIANKLTNLMDASSKVDKERASWFAKALALSGNEKYQSVLEDVAARASAKKVRKHAKIALQRLPRYREWNKVISSGLAETREELAIKRIKNMLAANNSQLFRLGAKRVYHAHSSNQELVALVKQELLRSYQSAAGSDEIDAMAWAIKVLAQSGDRSHKATLSEIAANANEKKIRKYAKKYADYL